MLTAQQIPNELKMVWDLDDSIARDPAEFAALTVLPQGFLPKQCAYYFFGERKAPLLEWRALMTSLQPLLDQRIKLRFICTSQKIADWLKEIGVFLLGEITCDPAAKQKS